MPATDTRTTSATTPITDATQLFAEATEVNTRYFQAWVAGAEGALKTSFELQTASFTAMSAFVDAAFAGQRNALQQSNGALHSGQQAVLDAFKAQVRAANRIAQNATSKA